MISLRMNSTFGRIGEGAPSEAATVFFINSLSHHAEVDVLSHEVGSCSSSISTSAAIRCSFVSAIYRRNRHDMPDHLVTDSHHRQG